MPQEQKRRHDPRPDRKPEEDQRQFPHDDELDDIINDAEEIIRKNEEEAKKRQPKRQ